MTLVFNNKWRIKSHDYGGYLTQKKVGQQWKEASYFTTLTQAANYLLEQGIYHKSTDIIINTINEAEAAIAQTELIKRIEHIRDEIAEVFHG